MLLFLFFLLLLLFLFFFLFFLFFYELRNREKSWLLAEREERGEKNWNIEREREKKLVEFQERTIVRKQLLVVVNRKFVGGRERERRNGGKSVDSKDESGGERLANKSWQAAADTADTTSGKNRCSVTEEARREKETRYIQWASCELSAKNSFLFFHPFLRSSFSIEIALSQS